MKYLYSAPNRAHHVHFAMGLWEHNLLETFLWAYPRWSPRANLNLAPKKLKHLDFWQSLYLLSGRLRFSRSCLNRLDWMSKQALDAGASRHLAHADGLIFYNGTGLNAIRKYQNTSKTFICEVVNAHVDFQSEILDEEARRYGLPSPKTCPRERDKRVAEYHEADYILGPSEFVKRTMVERGISEKKFLTIPYGIAASSAQPNSIHKDTTSLRVLYVGQLHLRKGLPYLVEAYKKLNYPGKSLTLIGARTPFNNLPSLNADHSIQYRGVLHGEALQSEFQSADVLVLPSIEDGFGLVVAEALGHGIPVITTSNTGSADLVSEGENGYVVPARSASSIRDKLQELADCPDRLQALKLGAANSANHLPSWGEVKGMLARTLSHLGKTREP